ncbi:MAG TPA: hypothetical protein VJZ76_18990 [Thermoanaerobaculia bacterium]|nr:hypothetical protein [Thermoanaerobaculia bacterium]
MGVDVLWKDASGLELDHVDDLPGWFAQAVARVQDGRREDFPVMQSIDLYGDTTVIPPRTDSLALELERIRDETAEVAARIHLGRVLSLARAASSRPGSFLEFAGD